MARGPSGWMPLLPGSQIPEMSWGGAGAGFGFSAAPVCLLGAAWALTRDAAINEGITAIVSMMHSLDIHSLLDLHRARKTREFKSPNQKRLEYDAALEDLAARKDHLLDAPDRLPVLDRLERDGHLVARFEGFLAPTQVDHVRGIAGLDRPMHDVALIVLGI